MKKADGPTINKVSAGSPASKAGLRAGWKLIRIDNQPVGDIIDYKIMESDHELQLLVLTDRGIIRRVKINKPVNEPLGLSFNPPTITKMQHCGNQCIFCFVDQNPPGMRASLYVKDDDYRLSFLYGNFITLNRLSEKELQRIINLRLSPLYVSVHTTNPRLRAEMFGTERAVKGLEYLRKLVDAGINIHSQVVLCPGYNDGRELAATVEDLAKMGPAIKSLAVVPLGLTGHRKGLKPLRKYSEPEAEDIIDKIECFQEKFLKQRGTRFVFSSDEFYNLASRPLPPDDSYENYPQLENGVGLSRQFLNELHALGEKLPFLPGKFQNLTIAAAPAAEKLLEELVEYFTRVTGVDINLQIVDNKYFGEEVTVSGLLTGSDLLRALKGKPLGDVVFITKSMLKDRDNIFLDDMTINYVENELQVSLVAVDGPKDFFSELLKERPEN